MHPPDFSIHHRLSDWPECRLELHCPVSPRMVDYPVRLLIAERGDRTFKRAVAVLRCQCCGECPAPVYLVAGQMRRSDLGGPEASWAVELVAPSLAQAASAYIP